jgi:uncharacterized HAD superfamily protein
MKKSGKIIGIDLDDTVLNFCDPFLAFHNVRRGLSYTRGHIKRFHIEEIWGCTRDEAIQMVHDFCHSDEHRNAVPVAGAVEAIADLAERHTLHIITAKPSLLKNETLAWIGKYFPEHFKDIHFTRDTISQELHHRKKSLIAQELGVELFIEDSLENALSIAAVDIPVLLLNEPWNQADLPPLVTRVHSWEEIVQKVG